MTLKELDVDIQPELMTRRDLCRECVAGMATGSSPSLSLLNPIEILIWHGRSQSVTIMNLTRLSSKKFKLVRKQALETLVRFRKLGLQVRSFSFLFRRSTESSLTRYL